MLGFGILGAELYQNVMDTDATVCAITLEKTDAGFTVTQSHLDVSARIPGADKAKVLELANAAKAGCPISRLLKANITMDAKLEV